MTLYITSARAVAALDNFVDAFDAGSGAATIKIYGGTIPADADAALGGAPLLATLTMSDPAFGAAADIGGSARATANAITEDSSADATGTATFFRCQTSDPTVVMQGGVGTSGEELNLNTTSIVANAAVSITSFTVTLPETP